MGLSRIFRKIFDKQLYFTYDKAVDEKQGSRQASINPSAAGPSFEDRAGLALSLGELTHEMVAPLPISLTNILKNIRDPEHQ